jgi:hypothetical protein
MIELLKQFYELFKAVTPESYHEMNTSKSVTYPYLTYATDSEELTTNTDGFYLDVDIFDNSPSYQNLYELEEQLKDQFKMKRILTDDLFLRFQFMRSTHIPTQDQTIKRRNLQFYCRVDWRKKQWH